jgi:outer membrane protein OmpA-like peptidoglycan-associated protein
MMRKIAVLAAAAFLCTGSARQAWAGATLTGETGLVTIPTTEVLTPWTIRLGTYGDGEIERDDQRFDRTDFSLGLGLLPNLELYSHIPIIYFTRSMSGVEDATSNGGLRLGFKYRLLDEADGAPASFALLGNIVVGIGSDSLPAILDRTTAFGRRETYEVMGILDRTLWKMPSGDPAILTLNAGGLFFDKPKHFSLQNQTTEFRRRFTGPNATFEDPFEFAAGVKAPLLRGNYGRLTMTGEFRGNTGTIDELSGSLPTQLFSGFRYDLPDATGLTLQGGVDFGLSGIYDNYRYLAGLTWQTPPPPAAAPVMAPPPAPPPPPPPPLKKKIVLRGVHFDFDKSNIREDSVPILREAAETLKLNPDVHVIVEGHTDSKGSDAYNDKLSVRRANAVRAYLVKLGIPANRMTVRGMGERQPVASNATDEGRAQNRRVELLVRWP